MKKSFVIIIAFILIIGITLLVKILIGDEYAKAKEVMKYLEEDFYDNSFSPYIFMLDYESMNQLSIEAKYELEYLEDTNNYIAKGYYIDNETKEWILGSVMHCKTTYKPKSQIKKEEIYDLTTGELVEIKSDSVYYTKGGKRVESYRLKDRKTVWCIYFDIRIS